MEDVQIVVIEPGKKYVLAFPNMSARRTKELARALESFMEDGEHKLFFVYGTEMTVVPADQVVGYTVLKPE